MRAIILLPAAAALLALSGAASGAESPVSWRDIESRIQYGYYTEDPAALRSLTGLIAADESHERLHGYYAALLDLRQAQLAAQGAAPGVSASELAQRCVDELGAVLETQADYTAALVLRAACLATPLNARNTALSARRGRKDIERALLAAPRDPRALLVDGLSDYQLAAAGDGSRDRALGKLRRAVAAFETERAGIEHLPGWGAAEAYLFLARDLLDHSDPVAARDALEHALLLAPEFAQARRLMAKIVAG